MSLNNLTPFQVIDTNVDWSGYNCTLNGSNIAYSPTLALNFSFVFNTPLTSSKAISYYSVKNVGNKATVVNLSGSGITLNGSDITITNSTINGVTTANSNAIGSSKINSTQAMVIYQTDTSNRNELRILTESAGVLSEGTGFPITDSLVSTGLTNAPVYAVDIIDSTRALVVHKNLSSHVVARVATYAGTTISSLGTPVTITTDTTARCIDYVKVSSGRFLLSHIATGGGFVSIVDVTGTTVSLTTTVTATTNAVNVIRTSIISPTNYVVVFAENTLALRARACTISGNTITQGTSTLLGLTGVSAMNLVSISSTDILMIHQEFSSPLFQRLGTIITPSGLTFTTSSSCDISNTGDTNGANAAGAADSWLEKIDSTRALFSYWNRTTNPTTVDARIISLT